MRGRGGRLVAGAALVALLGVISGCGGDDAPTTTTAVSSNPTKPVPAGAPLVDQDKLAFIPKELRVKAGTVVYFKNSESAVHTVNIANKNISGTMRKGDAFAWTFPAAGTFRITCDFHPAMLATVVVE